MMYDHLSFKMPTAMRVQGFRFFFYSDEGDEPVHIHVEKAESIGKVWLEPKIKIAYMHHFSVHEQKQVMTVIEKNIVILKQKWHEHFAQ